MGETPIVCLPSRCRRRLLHKLATPPPRVEIVVLQPAELRSGLRSSRSGEPRRATAIHAAGRRSAIVLTEESARVGLDPDVLSMPSLEKVVQKQQPWRHICGPTIPHTSSTCRGRLAGRRAWLSSIATWSRYWLPSETVSDCPKARSGRVSIRSRSASRFGKSGVAWPREVVLSRCRTTSRAARRSFVNCSVESGSQYSISRRRRSVNSSPLSARQISISVRSHHDTE